MLPTVLTQELIESIEAFLRSTFPTSTPAFGNAWAEILLGSGKGGLFRGPYFRIGLPFQPGKSGKDFFPRLKTKFPPYVHQEQAWERLRQEVGKSTLVATGTGSGKTECFTYPILDHILANPEKRGIKAIILYPMNALATDQARRFAKEVHESTALKGKVRVGLYVGGLEDGGGSKQMSDTEVITSRDELRSSPPDILLTNYKMLDYLLIRQDDQPLWVENQPDTLRYLVVDELHTFDGAQGSDLACLIRRVKARVKAPKGHLCCVGTSATLGGDDGKADMVKFAELIFGEEFPGDAVVMETRKTLSSHLEIEGESDQEILYFEPPGPEFFRELSPERSDSIESYIEKQTKLWFGERRSIETPADRLALAQALRRHNFLRTFLHYFNDGVLEEAAIIADLRSRRASWDEKHLKLILHSFASLCAIARSDLHGGYFLQLRSELWMRELARIVASVEPEPKLRFSMDLSADHPQRHLAAMHCRECGVMGWGGLQKANQPQLIPELDRFYQAFFSQSPDPRLLFIFPLAKDTSSNESLFEQHLCGSCLTLFESKDGTCPACSTGLATDAQEPGSVSTFRVEGAIRTKPRGNLQIADKSCPYCESTTGLTIVGSRAASLTSVGLSQLFGSPFNDDKKAMAFSDSVQDASHRSSFFSARTYQIALRTALYRVVEASEGELSVASLSDKFPAYWLGELGADEFVGRFIPPTAESLDEYESFKAERKLPAKSSLPSKVTDRLKWEVIREFGSQCRIGRTLEKSGAAACSLHRGRLTDSATEALKAIHDLRNTYSPITSTDVERLILGMSERQRVNGGIHHRFIESYISNRGNQHLFNRDNGEILPRIPKKTKGRRPTFFATFNEKDSFERLLSAGTTPTWTERWAQKWLASLIGEKAQEFAVAPIIEAVVAAITKAGLWSKHEVAQGEFAWALEPASLIVEAGAAEHSCQACGHQVTSALSAAELWKDAPCLRHKCDGRYQQVLALQGSFFGDLYRKGDVVRMRAAEHTGLLDRDTRVRTEQEFMRNPSLATDPKLLSCTPTMEMGVDVGDLSTVVLCSVPPEQSNYIQRVGRGGRRDGNSLALTVATNDTHDLTHYEEPLKMLAGEVERPAIFLRAPAVLERQLTAYCIDRWIESERSAMIPKKMEAIYVRIEKGDSSDKDAGTFPNALYRHIELNYTELFAGFSEMFDRGELDEASLTYLTIFLQGDDKDEGSLGYKINSALTAAAKNRDSLYKKKKSLTKALASNKAKQPRDERLDKEQDEMQAERTAIGRLIKELNDKQTLNFLSDEGLIPNYAFPEEGVTLRSIILKKPDKGKGDGKLSKTKFEHMRPAESAITELAPGSSFYVEGRKLTVDQVSIEQEDYEEWHFCRSCSHLEPVSSRSEAYLECPDCKCPGWRDNSLRQSMLKMRQVFVTAWDGKSRVYDQKDNRDPTIFNKQVSVSHEKAAVRKSYSLRAEGTTFAFDFLDLVTLREVNFGEDRPNADSLQIGGKTLQGVGFLVCSSCGKIQSARSGDDPKHDIACKHYGKGGGQDEFERTFLLYRQLESEAIRMLIPSVSQDDNVDTQSFVAAIHLGLKRKFGGHLSHLKLAIQNLPIAGSNLRTQYVFVYDSVPGGTGYLKDLTLDGHAFMEILELAYEALSECSCGKTADQDDGCYRCIKAYRFRFVQNHISRRTAIGQLKRILDHRENIVERSADDSLINPLLESELERRFIESLRQVDGFLVNHEVVEKRTGYLLRCEGSAWKIVPQVDLGPEDGVSIPCRPDFILRPLRPSRGMPIAVFLDGFSFHADVELDNNRIADDIAKRNAIRRSNRYLVWSLTWGDLKEDHPVPVADAFLGQGFANLPQILNEQAPEAAGEDVFQSADWNSWDLLVAFLQFLASSTSSHPLEQWRIATSFLAFNFPERAPVDDDGIRSALDALLINEESTLIPANTPSHMAAGHSMEALRFVSAVPMASLKSKSLDGAFAALWFDDLGDKPATEFLTEWWELLRVCNLLQFVPRFGCFTRLMLKSGGATNVDWLMESEETSSDDADSGSLSSEQIEELELLDESLQPLLIPALKDAELPWPEMGYEAIGSSGQCSSSFLEVAWPGKKVGIALPDDETTDFIKDGWTVLLADGLDLENLKSVLNS